MYMNGLSGDASSGIDVAKPDLGTSKPGVSTTSSSSSGDFFTNLLTDASQLLQVVNQQKLSQLNLRRVSQGLPAIDVNSIPGLVPTYQLQTGLDSSTQQAALIGLVVLGGVALTISIMHRKPRGSRRHAYA